METKNRQGGGKTLWHPAFYKAVQQELFDYRDSLEFKFEHPLNTEPLCIDLLIIKKPKNVTINKNIARIFRSDNILEYKSPQDYLAVNDYLKVNAYANLYSAITPGVDFAELTLTFVEYRHPRKLIKHLTRTRGYTVNETSPGIYLVSGDYLPIQIIESGKLPERENLWLRSLTKGLQAVNVVGILEEADKCGNKASLGAYLDVLFRANPEALKEAKNMARRGLPSLEEALEISGLLPEFMELREKKVLETTARNAMNKGLPIDLIHDITGLDIETLEQIANKTVTVT